MKAQPVRTLQLAPACSPGVRLPELDRLKGLALLLVILYHGGGVLGYGNWLHGEVGVDIFLIASGFTLVLNNTALPTGQFLQRRFFRLYPSYWIALTVLLLLNAHFYGDYRKPIDIVLHVAGLHGFSRPEFFSAISDPLWYISAVVLLYIVFLALRRHLHDLALVVGVGGLLTFAVCQFYETTHNDGGIGHLGVRVPTLFLGLILGQFASGRRIEIRFTPLLAAGLAAFVYVAMFQGVNFAYPVAGLAWVVLFLCFDRWAMHFRTGRALGAILTFLGVYSYEIYLFHQPMMRDYDRLVMFDWFGIVAPTPANLWAAMTVALAVVLVASVLLHQATERLFRSLRKPLLR